MLSSDGGTCDLWDVAPCSLVAW